MLIWHTAIPASYSSSIQKYKTYNPQAVETNFTFKFNMYMCEFWYVLLQITNKTKSNQDIHKICWLSDIIWTCTLSLFCCQSFSSSCMTIAHMFMLNLQYRLLPKVIKKGLKRPADDETYQPKKKCAKVTTAADLENCGSIRGTRRLSARLRGQVFNFSFKHSLTCRKVGFAWNKD